jgi:nicotinamide riboside transporter PnuC
MRMKKDMKVFLKDIFPAGLYSIIIIISSISMRAKSVTYNILTLICTILGVICLIIVCIAIVQKIIDRRRNPSAI